MALAAGPGDAGARGARRRFVAGGGWWAVFYRTVTCCCPAWALSRAGGMHSASAQEAWREKVALCVVIVLLCAALAFLTFGFSIYVCQPGKTPAVRLGLVRQANDPASRRFFIIHGQIYNIPAAAAQRLHPHAVDVYAAYATQDISVFFPFAPTCPDIRFACRLPGEGGPEHCHNAGILNRLDFVGDVAYEWRDIERAGSTYVVYNGEVLDTAVYLDQVPADSADPPFGRAIDAILRASLGKDASKALAVYDAQTIDCMFEHLRAGVLEMKTMGCVFTDIVLYVSLVVILALVFAKFFLAIGFAFVMGRRLGRPSEDQHHSERLLLSAKLGDDAPGAGSKPGPARDGYGLSATLKSSRYAQAHVRPLSYAAYSNAASDQVQVPAAVEALGLGAGTGTDAGASASANVGTIPPLVIKPRADSTTSPDHMYTILLVTCYSEGEAGLRTTLDSLTATDYDDTQKLLFVVADGIIKGAGNDRSTPDILIGMMEPATELFEPYYFDADGHPLAHAYVALADGTRRNNMARVYPGYYRCGLHRVPMVLVVKCGAPAEADKPKPGNRGKRDSQIIIMGFLNKVLFDDRMTPLDYDLFYKITRLTGGVPPDNFELVLMVDADTKVMSAALHKLVQVMRSDPMIMGCCGETRIANKADSWVTMIQVHQSPCPRPRPSHPAVGL